ncbi:trypsin-like peptidase domain-containing protein [Streptomyces sp. NPDC058398]|uniref:trypsin-like peptidase domain-containing protein n=1 Tax=Streptomyces sp. NPDC058398 TaxID=3346479 RepID=UPI00365B11A1
MNDGRPTKANRWSRPRPEDAGPDTAPADLTEPDAPRPAASRNTVSGTEPSAPEERTRTTPAVTRAEAAAPAHGTVPAAAVPAQAGAPADALPLVPRPESEPEPEASEPPNPMSPGPRSPADPDPADLDPDPAVVPSAPVGSDGPVESGTADPWRNYDPWAASTSPRHHGHLPGSGPGGSLQQSGPLQQNGVAVPTVAQRRRRARKALVLAAVALALASGGVGGVVGAYLERNGGLTDIELPQAAKEAPGRAPDSVAGIAAHALPSVVTLHVHGSEEDGTGTGFVLDGEGHILTNNHVIQPAGGSGTITVTFSGGQTAKARVVGHDSGYDLAVVKVSGVRGLAPMPLGNSDSVQVGDPVVAIGAPFDLANTVTSGIISAKDRPITAGGEKGDGTDVSYVDALQTDAPINPGNSGGPLLDSRARVIGINSAIRSADSGSDLETGQAGSIGLGFAIPVNQAKRVAEELINTGRATHPVIGVTLDMNYSGDGARVGTEGAGGGAPVTPGGPGAEAGIRAGDVITEVDGTRVHSGEELIVKTRAHRPGDRLRLTVRRGGANRTITLVLGSANGG